MRELANALALGGACILLAALHPLRRLILQLPNGKARKYWIILGFLILAFIAGYIGYAVAKWNESETPSDLFAPAIFFLGAVFVLLVNTVSLQTAIDIRRFAALEQESITDPLMGIHNRRYMDRRLREEVKRAVRYKLPLSVLLLDIDHFKRVNDEFGHPAGDLVLAGLGRLIADTVRDTDVVARYGGEEILIIAVSTPPPAYEFAERLRRKVEESLLVEPCELTGGREIRLTVSIGVASLGNGPEEAGELVNRADKALYRAKGEGRNRVVMEAWA